jgi:hypothetical protein
MQGPSLTKHIREAFEIQAQEKFLIVFHQNTDPN